MLDPGTTGFRGAKDGGKICIQPLLVLRMFSRQGADDIGEMFSVMAKKRARRRRLRLPEFVEPETGKAHAPQPARQFREGRRNGRGLAPWQLSDR